VGDESQFLNESFKEAALRELEEETGFFAEKIEYVCELGTTLGLSNETVQVFFAKNLIKKSEGGGTIDEAIVVHLVPLKNLTKWLSEKQSLGYVLDYKIYSLAYLYEKKNFL
jgi:ADP-ribose pyrophosphatase